ncbi:MAG: 4-hydroxythreonine-4-phosphate dehydrogenase PdxA [Bacteroidetes bacterium]|nr:4-hydroxythreonine-4-phosphate dehydrogenase PdxA [Bacteroidota bacterium]
MDYAATKVGITIGDVNGISVEILLKAFTNPYLLNNCTPVVYGHINALKFYQKHLDSHGIEFNLITKAEDAVVNSVNVINVVDNVRVIIGQAETEAGKLAVTALKRALQDILEGKIQNLVTLPIDKSVCYSDDFPFEGHTDFLASSFETEDYMMLLVSDSLKIGVVTGHIPISEVSKRLNKDLLTQKIEILKSSLIRDFSISKPRIAVLGLNPHAGDHGVIGDEEQKIIKPVIEEFINSGDLVYGPFPADGFFGSDAFEQYDAVLAMYHDQGLIPFKQMAFHDGVNYTAGLPIVRTSPDHGTAFNIAGKGIASAESLVNSIFLQKKIYKNRIEYLELTKDPLPFTKHRREKFSIGVPNLK